MIIEHGTWVHYTPAEPYKDFAGSGTPFMYAQRSADNKDWYVFVNDETPFQPGSVKMTAYQASVGLVVGAATYDATQLWPANALLLEETDYGGSDPQMDYGSKIYDPATGTFSDRAPPAQSPSLADMLKRIEALEGGR